MLYAADVWFTPAFRSGSDATQRGSIGITKKMTSVQRIAALAITGAMRTTATDLLEAHTNLLPITLLLQNTCHQAIIQLAAHPSSHPLHTHVKRTAACYVEKHRTSLHRLTCSFHIDPAEIETLTGAIQHPSHTCPYSVHIAETKEKSIEELAQLPDRI
jgi:hypothetical protein